VVAGVLLAAAAACATPLGGPRGEAPTPAASPSPAPTEEASRPPAAAPATDVTDRTVVVGRHGEVELVVPSAYALLVGFHEAGNRGALALEVTAPVTADHAGAGVGPDEPAEDAPVTVIVLPARRRGTPPTTAMDVVVPRDRPIVSPVDGTVVAVEDYLLYGQHPDVRIVIRSAADPRFDVVLLHVEDARVAVGDEVRAGGTVVAERARPLPEPSQIDRYTRHSVREEAPPHAHVEVRRAG
jgi:murein DD-endopeptidase MepM/ murein hydrolase activator NlpD